MSQLPPQAYTRDVLAAAYEWLRHQPASIRELATDSDSLVALYLQSRRRPGSLAHMMGQTNIANKAMVTPSIAAPAPTAPQTEIPYAASAEAFKQDLKNLAEGLKQFDSPRAHQAHPHQTHHVSHTPQNNLTQNTQTTTVVVNQAPAPVASVTLDLSSFFDAKSLEIIRDVQRRLNLSHEKEALRMLIVLGYDRIKEILPKNP